MKTDLMTKGLLVFVGSGMWALAVTHWQVPVATAQSPAAAPGAQDVVRAQRLVIVDANGKVRASLGSESYGYGLTFNDEKGKTRAALYQGQYGSGLSLHDENGRERSLLTDEPLFRPRSPNKSIIFEQPDTRPKAQPMYFHEYR